MKQTYSLKNPEETDLYNETMDKLGPQETETDYSVWQAVPRDVGENKGARVMAGSRAIIRDFLKKGTEDEKRGVQIATLRDGMPFFAGDPVFQVIGEKSNARKLEPKILSTLYYMTGIATRTKRLIDSLGQNRVIDVGMRGQAPGSWNYATEAFLIGGGKLTATTTIRNVPDLVEGRDYTLVGTTGHSLYLEYLASGYTQKEAFQKILVKFENAFPGRPCALLVDTVEPMLGINQALSVINTQKKRTGQTHWIRLDSGDLFEQGKYALEQMLEIIPDFKVIIEDGLTLERALEYDARFRAAGFNPEQNILYGFGGHIVNDLTRDRNGAWAYKPSVFETTNNGRVSVIKLSGNPFKNSLAGLIGISYNTNGHRLVVYDESKNIRNKILTFEEAEKYMAQSIDELSSEAKRFWEQDSPKAWGESYDLDEILANERRIAGDNTHQFGNDKLETQFVTEKKSAPLGGY